MCQGWLTLAVTLRATVSPGFARGGVISVEKVTSFGLAAARLSFSLGAGPEAGTASGGVSPTSNRADAPDRRADGPEAGRTVSSASGRVHWPGKLQFWSEQIM